jgi:hypothetical protein
MNWLKKLMTGRYGGDQLGMVLLIVSVILTFAGDLTRLRWLTAIGYIPLGVALFRMLSRNTAKRSMENYKFSIWVSPFYAWLKKTEDRIKHAKTHAYFTCPGCKQSLRVPKGKGKIVVICPKCKTEFKGKS